MSAIKALLLTDVVDSTRLSEALGDAAAAELWARTTGSRATCCRPGAGARSTRPTACCCCSTTRPMRSATRWPTTALAALPVPLTARAGLHVGPVILRENSVRRHRAGREAARGRRPGQAHRRQGDGAGARRPDAALGRRPRRPRQERAQAGLAWALAAQGRVRSDRAVRDRRHRTPSSCHRPTAKKRIASSGWATGGCRSTRS